MNISAIKLKGTRIATRIITTVLLLCILSAAPLFALLIAANADHEHTHSSPDSTCVTCSLLSVAQTVLKQLSSTSTQIVSGIACILLLIPLPGIPLHKPIADTPVSLKIKLNN